MSVDKRTFTIYVQIIPQTELDRSIRPDRWVPWVNCTSRDETMKLAAHKWMREAGYLTRPNGEDDRPDTITLDVLAFDQFTDRHANGNPTRCERLTITFARN